MKQIILLATFICSACGPAKVSKRETDPLPIDFKMTFKNLPIDSTAHVSLASIFGLENPADGKVLIGFDHQGDLKLSCKNNLGGDYFVAYKGKSRKNSYEVFLRKKRIPFYPFYAITDVSRVRLRLKCDSTLVVDHYWNRSGMILIMAAGHSSKIQYQFNKIK